MSHDIFIFGSAVRGEVSVSSDIDVLVIPVGAVVKDHYPASWSVYSREAVRDYYRGGRLFAWHLHLGSKCIFSASAKNWLQVLGQPATYDGAREDVHSLIELLEVSLTELRGGSESTIYELGICYTALRDIAMAASWRDLGAHCFSRYVPFKLAPPVPLDREAYECAMLARHYSTRGGQRPGDFDAAKRAFLEAPLLEWARLLGEGL